MSRAAQDRLEELEVLAKKPDWTRDEIRDVLLTSTDRRRVDESTPLLDSWPEAQSHPDEQVLGMAAQAALSARLGALVPELVEALTDAREAVRRAAFVFLTWVEDEDLARLTTDQLLHLTVELARRTEPVATGLRARARRLLSASVESERAREAGLEPALEPVDAEAIRAEAVARLGQTVVDRFLGADAFVAAHLVELIGDHVLAAAVLPGLRVQLGAIDSQVVGRLEALGFAVFPLLAELEVRLAEPGVQANLDAARRLGELLQRLR